jgi:hypothetical protein
MPMINWYQHEYQLDPGVGTRAGNWFSGLWQDVRQATRMLRRNAAFSAMAIATLALGIGLATAMCSVLNGTRCGTRFPFLTRAASCPCEALPHIRLCWTGRRPVTRSTAWPAIEASAIPSPAPVRRYL